MIPAPTPPDEAARLAALKEYAVLDTPAEADFDDFTALAAQICGTPIALISLIDANRQWFKSAVGLTATETPRDQAFCTHAILGSDILEVPDARADDRFHDNPLVTGAPNIRFYAGTPLTTPGGHGLGTLCVIDRVARRLSPDQRDALARLGRQVVHLLELRRIHAALRANEDRLRQAQRIAKIGSWELDLQTNTLHWSDEVFRLFEIDPIRVTPSYQAFLKAIHPEDRDRVDKAYTDSLRTRHPYRIVHRLLLPGGHLKHVEEQCETDFAPNGSPLRSRGTVQDISKHIFAEEATARAHREIADIKAALDQHAIVAITDPSGKITYVNDKFCAISKYSRAELLGQDHRILNSGHHPSEFFRALWTTIAHGEVWQGEICNRAKDGSLYWVQTTIVPFLRPDGKPHQYIAIRADITERKNAEEARARMASTIEAANQELTNFAYVVSHDLKAPLRGISSLASWLEADYAEKLGPDGRDQLALLQSRVRRLNALIDGILTYSRAGRVREQRVPVDLHATVRNVIDLLAPPAHIRVEIATPLPTLVCEPTRIAQVFQNLIGNAIKYLDKPQGLIRVSCARLDEAWQFSIADNGPGIDAKYFEKIFQLFQTLASGDDVKGTGVGLSVVKKIVELDSGRIWVESTLGSGTTFHFTLPTAHSP